MVYDQGNINIDMYLNNAITKYIQLQSNFYICYLFYISQIYSSIPFYTFFLISKHYTYNAIKLQNYDLRMYVLQSLSLPLLLAAGNSILLLSRFETNFLIT